MVIIGGLRPLFHSKKITNMINVLCTQSRSLYYNYDFFNCYDFSRNVFTLDNNLPCIAHPPCRLFSRLRKFSTAPIHEKKIAFFCLDKVRRFGGILEHPRSSTLWHTGNFDLSGQVDSYGGFLRSVDFSWFGYPARKKTMLYFVGISPSALPPFPISLDAISACVGSSSSYSNLKALPISLRSQTPRLMIEYFIQVMNIISKKNIKKT